VLVVLLTLGLALASRVLPGLATRLTAPTGGAQWIWETRDRRDVSAAAFYAVHDFAVETPPATARLLVTADEEYVLSLNGRRIGVGSWEQGAPLDVYEVGPLLQPGPNRLVAELRSGRGAGGFLLSLNDGEGHQLARTDESWRVFHRDHPGIVRGWLPLERKPEDSPDLPESEPAFCWGLPPTGSWGRPVPGDEPRPLLFERASGRIPAVAAPTDAGDGPQQALFDWGREVVGYPVIELAAATELRVGLLFTGDKPPNPWEDRPVASVLVPAGQRMWMAARPGRFRYAMVLGMEAPLGAGVEPVDAALLPRLLPTARSLERGVFGIVPPPLRTPVEDKVWGKL
jgi:hypothetical protein